MFVEKNNEGQRSFWSAKHRWFLDMVLGISAFVVDRDQFVLHVFTHRLSGRT